MDTCCPAPIFFYPLIHWQCTYDRNRARSAPTHATISTGNVSTLNDNLMYFWVWIHVTHFDPRRFGYSRLSLWSFINGNSFHFCRTFDNKLVRVGILGAQRKGWLPSAGRRFNVRCLQRADAWGRSLYTKAGWEARNTNTWCSIEDEGKDWTWWVNSMPLIGTDN